MANGAPARHAAMRRALAGAGFVAALAAAGWRAPPAPTPAFAPVATAATRPAPPRPFAVARLGAPTAHAPSLAELPDGRLAAAWLAPDAADANAEAIWFAIGDGTAWQPARPALDRAVTAGAALAHIDRLGAPLLQAEGGWLHLWYLAAALGADIGQGLQHSVSTDGGRHWSPPRRLAVAPLAVGENLGTAPLALADGGFALLLGRDAPTASTAWIVIAANDRPLAKWRLPLAAAAPAPTVLGERQALVVGGGSKTLSGGGSTALTADGGATWSAGTAAPTSAGAPALIRLHDGRLLLAGAASDGGPAIEFHVSADAGQHWRPLRRLAAADDGAPGRPALLQTRDGRIHVLFASARSGLQHAAFDVSWLEAAP